MTSSLIDACIFFNDKIKTLFIHFDNVAIEMAAYIVTGHVRTKIFNHKINNISWCTRLLSLNLSTIHFLSSNLHSPFDQQIILSTTNIKLIICRNNDRLARFLKALTTFQASEAILREKGFVAPEIGPEKFWGFLEAETKPYHNSQVFSVQNLDEHFLFNLHRNYLQSLPRTSMTTLTLSFLQFFIGDPLFIFFTFVWVMMINKEMLLKKDSYIHSISSGVSLHFLFSPSSRQDDCQQNMD